MLGLFAAAGTVSAALPLAYGGVALTICAVFFVVLRSGLSLRTRVPNLALVQMGATTALQLACMAYAPHLAFVFLNILFIVFAFGALRLNVRQSLIAVLAVSAAAGRRRCWCGCASPPLSRAACSRASTAAPCG